MLALYPDVDLMQGLIAAAVTALALWLFLPLCRSLGLVDRPGGRKDHARPTPLVGGLAMALGVGSVLLLHPHVPTSFQAFSAAALILLAVGFLDDLRDIKWYWRILAQVASALIMIYWGGVRVESIGPIFSVAPIELGALSVPFTIFATVSVINAVNMCDGVDGLAGTLCLVALAMLAAAAVYSGNIVLFAALIPMMGAIAAFLLFNMRFPWQRSAQVFMGNAGSMFLGFTIVWVAFRLTQNPAHPVSPAIAPWLIAPPLVDTVVLFVRRIRGGKSPFAADTEHMHHLMLAGGFSPAQVVVLLGGASAVLGAGACLLYMAGIARETTLVLGFVAMTVYYFWLTRRRERAVAAFIRLRRTMGFADCRRSENGPRPARVTPAVPIGARTIHGADASVMDRMPIDQLEFDSLAVDRASLSPRNWRRTDGERRAQRPGAFVSPEGAAAQRSRVPQRLSATQRSDMDA